MKNKGFVVYRRKGKSESYYGYSPHRAGAHKLAHSALRDSKATGAAVYNYSGQHSLNTFGVSPVSVFKKKRR